MTMADISRRRFVQAMGAVSATSVFALAGCNSQRASEAGGDEGGSEGAVADTITFAQGADPRGLDPAFVDDGESAKIMCNIYDTLLYYDTESCDIVPGLADLPEISDDGLVYTFKLQEGVKFHDGTDCNAEAVKKNIDRQLEPNRTADMPYAGFVYGAEDSNSGVASVEAPDDTTVVITLRSASIASAVACWPSTTGAGSAEKTRMIKKTMIETPSSTGMASRMRLSTYLSTRPSFLSWLARRGAPAHSRERAAQVGPFP